MRPLRFLVPGTTGRYRCGGLLVGQQTARLLADLVPTELVTYRQREEGLPFLNDLLRAEPLGAAAANQALWIVSWGFDVPRQLRALRGRPAAYHAHSSGYGFRLPPGVPVLAVSRNTLGYWGQWASRNPLFLVPNALGASWIANGNRPHNRPPHNPGGRTIDVLVQRRKCSAYVLERLVPALRALGLRVEVQDGWVEDLVGLFNSATVVLYDSADHWRCSGVSEGFGLPPVEALACGCVLFSSFNHALADTLDPGGMAHQIGAGTLAADVERIAAAVADPAAWLPPPRQLEELLDELSEPRLRERWRQALIAINAHLDRLQAGEPPLLAPSLARLRLERWRQRFGKRLPAGLARRLA
ncbi:glycosyltransferase family 1 protein [Cyanobium sp. Aljojuca 7D2]|uniref:glycosyltransferase family 1 protein n=1 Tax=Cyanobium sp. Aljojuca 7D2 TaxID=2823698 RepID=UPI0020CEFBD3|nr:glycosyltransferase family 1 protein [Cyanobium sp. Aljojuca 7D2]MCP9890758.1 glycosyltransferase family 1 protein [Cyanobium sp. Aljojuca 7D2]